MKRRLNAFLMASALVVSLTACGSSEPAATKAPETTKAAEAAAPESKEEAKAEDTAAENKADKPVKIGWLQKNQSNAFELVINGGGEELLEQAKADGIVEEYYLLDGQTDPSIQVSQATDLVNLGVDAVIMQPAELDGSAPVVDICHEAGIPVVLVNSLTSNADDCEGLSISNDVEAGELLANFVLEQLGDTGKYAHLQGIIGNTAAIQRTEGIHNVMDKQAGWEMLEEQSAEWSGDKASRFTQDWIALYGDAVNAILCENEDMAVAARLACLEAGREDIVCIGVDATEAALAMVADGELHGTVRQDGHEQGRTAVEKAIALAQGKKVEQKTVIPFTVVTKDNVAEYYPAK